MILVRYAEWGTAVPDKGVQNWAKMIQSAIEINRGNKNRDVVFCVSNSLPFTFLRLLIVQGKINHQEIKFLYHNGDKDLHVSVNEYGAITDWPTGFCDMEQDVVEELLKTAMNKRHQTELFGKKAGVA